MLNRALVLVAEDEPFIALDVAMAVEDAGGEVLGPAASVREALELIDGRDIAAAILDVNLIDGDVSPLAEALIARGVPILLQSGIGLPLDLAARFPDLAFRLKPCTAAVLVRQLADLIAAQKTA